MAGQAGRRRGTVKQSANGTWYFVVDIADDAGKRRQTRRRGFATQGAAQNALNGVLQDLARRTYVAPSRQTLATFLTDEWLPAIETTVRPSTFDSYSRNVRNHVAKHPLGDMGLQKVDAAALNRFYADLLGGRTSRRPLAPRSVAYIHVILHRALRPREPVHGRSDDREQSQPPGLRTVGPKCRGRDAVVPGRRRQGCLHATP